MDLIVRKARMLVFCQVGDRLSLPRRAESQRVANRWLNRVWQSPVTATRYDFGFVVDNQAVVRIGAG